MKKLIKLIISTIAIIFVCINAVHAIILNDNNQFISGVLYNYLDNTNIFAVSPKEANNLSYTNITEMFANYEKEITSIKDKNSNILSDEEENIPTGSIITTSTSEEFTTLLYGDANGDGIICNEYDVEVVKNDYLNTEKANGVYKLAADICSDDKLNVKDIQKMLLKSKGNLDSGLVDSFPDSESIHYATFMADEQEVGKIKFTVRDGLLGEEPDVPEKLGYTKEWNTYEFIESDITIEAKYTPIVYEITYETNGGSFENNPKITYTIEDESKELSIPEKENYVFEGWYQTEDLTGEKLETLEGKTENLTLYAKYVSANYKTNLNKYYLTLNDAIGYANENETVTTIIPLVNTIETIDATYDGIQELTIDLSEKTITLNEAKLTNNSNLAILGTGTIETSGVNLITNTGTLKLVSGNIVATSSNAIYNDAGTIEMSGVNITSGGNGIWNESTGTILVTGGTITAEGDYGIRGLDAELTIGTKADSVNVTSPSIKGRGFGISIAEGKLNFYDGIIKGLVENSIEGTITDKPSGYVVVNGTEVIDDIIYETSVLGPSLPEITAKLEDENGTEYVSGTWTNQNVYVCLASANVGSGIKEYQWKEGESATWQTVNLTTANNIGEITFTVNRDEIIYFRAIDNNGVISAESSIEIRKETSLPTVSLEPNGGTYTIPAGSNKITIETTISALDVGESSLKSIEIAWSQSKETEPENYTLVTNNAEITKEATGGNWYLWTRVLDNAGNRATTVKISNAFIVNYEIAYDVTGGKGTLESQIKTHDVDLELSKETPTKSGYVFKGWATTEDASTVEYEAGATYTTNTAITLYAVWIEAVASTTINENITYYESIQDAINASGTSHATVTVLKSVTADSAIVEKGQDIILNLNEKTVTFVGTSLENNGTLTIAGTSGSLTSSGSETIINTGTLTKNTATQIINTSTSEYYALRNSGTLTISSGTLESSYRGIYNEASGKITISGGTFSTTGTTISNYGNSSSETSPALEITGSPIFNVKSGNIIANTAKSTGTIYIKNGTYNSTTTTNSAPSIINSGNGKIIIAGGTINHDGENAAVFNGYNSGTSTGTIEIRGGTINSIATLGVKNHELGTIIISGGTISSYKAGVYNESTGNIQITNGTITSSTTIGASCATGNLTVSGDETKITGSMYGIYVSTGKANIISGTINATNGKGLYVVGGTVNLGEKEDETPIVNLEYPSITGTTYGVHVSSGTFNFYDGIITGPTGLSISGTVKEIPTGYIVRKTTSGAQEIATLGSSGPVITAKLVNSSGATYNSGTWTNKNVYVKLTTTENGSGIKEYQWKEGSTGTWKTSSLTTTDNVGTITFTGNRNSTIYFRSVDNNDVISDVSAIIIRKETTAPSNLTIDRAYKAFPNNNYTITNATITSDYTVTTTSTNPYITLKNVDRYTNIKEIIVKFKTELTEDIGTFQVYYSDDGTFSQTNSVTASSNLTAGTSEVRLELANLTKKYIRVDIGNLSGVSYQIEGIYFVTDDTIWNNSSIMAELSATDIQSGIKEYQWHDSSDWTNRNITITDDEGAIKFNAARNEAVQFRVLDKAGNISATVTSQINIDLTKPTVTLGTNGGTATITAGNTTANISTTLTASDTGGSGLKILQYAWSQSNTTEPTSWTTFTNKGTVTKAATGGKWYLWTRVIDNAGNRATSTKVSNVFTVKYQVTYDANGGTGAPSTQTKTHGTALTLSSTVPTKTGYNFAGWATTADATTSEYAAKASYTANKSIKLYAIWTAKTLKVTFMRNTSSTDTTSATQTFTYGVADQKFSSKGWTKTGYTLKGWAKTSDATTAAYVVTSEVIDSWINTNSPSITLYAVWSINSYTVTYDKNYLDEDLWGNTYLPTQYHYASTAPTSKVATENTAAKYGKQVEFTMGAGTGGVYYKLPKRLTVGTQYTWSIYIKASTACTLNMGAEQGGRKSVNVTTSWQRIRYTFTAKETNYYQFTFYNNSAWTSGDKLYIHSLEIMEGTPTLTTQTMTYGTELGTLSTPTRTGYTFKGWYTAPVGGTKISSTTTVPAKDVTYYAQWTVKSYTVTYNYSTNGGTSATTTSASVNYGVNIDLTSTATKDGWTFVGWNTDSTATTKLSSLKMSTSNVTLYAIYSKTLTGTFKYYNNQSTTKSITIYNTATSGSITSPASPGNPNGYGFRHWSTSSAANASKTVAASTAITISASTTYYASYSKPVTGTFYYCTLSATDYVYSSAEQASVTATATQFMGYTGTIKESNFTVPTAVTGSTGGAGAQTYKGVATSKNSVTTVTPTTANTKFYAVYTESVTFYYYNGSSHTSKTSTRRMLSDETTYSASLSADVPTPSAYDSATFLAWSYDSNKYESGYRREPLQTGSGTLYAIYCKSVTATFNYHNGSAAASTTASSNRYYVSKSGGITTFNTNITIPTAVKTNRTINDVIFTYRGVSTSKTANATVATPTTANTTYYASYSYIVTLTFNGNSATSGTAPSDISKTAYMNYEGTKVGGSITMPSNPFTRTGYTFAGWVLDSTTNTKIYTAGTAYTYTASHTVYAKWTGISYTVNYYNGSTKLGSSSHTYGTAKALTTMKTLGGTKDGFTFYGWTKSTSATARTYTDGQSVNNLTSTSGGTVTLYAIWQRTATFYSGASKAKTSTATQYYNSKGGNYSVTTPTPTAITNWTTLGWRNDTTAGAKEYSSATAITASSVTYYAVYSRNATFYSGIAKATSEKVTQYYNSNGAYKVTAPALENIAAIDSWTALGWKAATTADSSVYEGGASITVSNATYYAAYSRTVTVAYNGNGSTSGSTASHTATQYYNSYGSISSPAFTLKANGFTKTGHTFSKWAAGSTSGTQYAASASYTFDPAVDTTTLTKTMYAIWTINSYTVTYNYSTNGGTSATKTSATVNYNAAIDLTPTATKDGWTFVGWNTSSTATTKLSSLKMGTSNVTLYAIYSKTLTGTFKYYNNQTNTQKVTIYNTATSGKITSPAALGTPSGYTFRHWSTSNAANASKTVAASTQITLTENKTYYASYSKTVTGTFYYCTLAEDTATFSSAAQSSATATATQYIGYTGTKKESNFTVPTAVTGSFGGTAAPNYVGVAKAVSSSTIVTPTTANTKFYAVYDEDITFYYYDGTNHTSSGLTRYMLSDGSTYGTALSGDVPTPAKYDSTAFLAWSYYATEYTSTYRKTPLSTGVSNFYAIYCKSITATFNYHDGSAATSKTASAYRYYVSKSGGINTYNTNITVPDVVKANRTISGVTYKYRGVSTATAGNATVATPTTANTTYYASYSYTVTIKFNGNNATSGTAPSNISKTAYMNYKGTKVKASITMPSNPFTKTGYSFGGWNLDSATSTTTYTAGSTYSFQESHTLYAKWNANNYQNTNTSVYYVTLKSALSAATTGQTIKVLNSVTETTVPSLAANKTVTLNTNGKTTTLNAGAISISGTLIISGSGTITSSNSNIITNNNVLKIQDTASIVATNSSYKAIYNSCKVDLQGGTIKSNGVGISNAVSSSEVLISGDANITAVSHGISSVSTSSSAVVITGTNAKVNSQSGNAIYNGGSGTVTVSGGTITNGESVSDSSTIVDPGNCVIGNASTGKIVINGGSVKTSGSNKNIGIFLTDGTLSMESGSIYSYGTAVYCTSTANMTSNSYSCTISVTGGTITGRIGIENLNEGVIRIFNGTVSGIGGATATIVNHNTGDIYVHGGSVNAGYGSPDTIIMNGGRLYLYGKTSSYSGASVIGYTTAINTNSADTLVSIYLGISSESFDSNTTYKNRRPYVSGRVETITGNATYTKIYFYNGTIYTQKTTSGTGDSLKPFSDSLIDVIYFRSGYTLNSYSAGSAFYAYLVSTSTASVASLSAAQGTEVMTTYSSSVPNTGVAENSTLAQNNDDDILESIDNNPNTDTENQKQSINNTTTNISDTKSENVVNIEYNKNNFENSFNESEENTYDVKPKTQIENTISDDSETNIETENTEEAIIPDSSSVLIKDTEDEDEDSTKKN